MNFIYVLGLIQDISDLKEDEFLTAKIRRQVSSFGFMFTELSRNPKTETNKINLSLSQLISENSGFSVGVASKFQQTNDRRTKQSITDIQNDAFFKFGYYESKFKQLFGYQIKAEDFTNKFQFQNNFSHQFDYYYNGEDETPFQIFLKIKLGGKHNTNFSDLKMFYRSNSSYDFGLHFILEKGKFYKGIMIDKTLKNYESVIASLNTQYVGLDYVGKIMDNNVTLKSKYYYSDRHQVKISGLWTIDFF